MKKIVSTILVFVLLFACVASLTSCDKMLVGTYEADLLLYEATYEFMLGGKVVLTVDPAIGSEKIFEGKYSVDEEAGEITFVFEGEDAKEYTGTRSFAKGEENGEKYIKLDGIKYTEDN